MKIHDVTLTLSEALPVWPGDPDVSIQRSCSLEKGAEANVTRLSLSVHSGTHIDAPFHFDPEGVGVDQLSLEGLVGPCRLIEISEEMTAIDAVSLKKQDLEGVTRLLFRTRNSAWSRAEGRGFCTDFAYLTAEGARYLLSRGVKLVGIDSPSIEKFESPGYPVHRLLLGNHVIILEGLNLYGVPAGDYELIALPLKIKGADGAPARVVLREGYAGKK